MSKKTNIFDMGDIDISWCPGCGDYQILATLQETLVELDIKPENLVMVSGIGQAAKIPQYLKCNFFNGLHGRSLPAAWAIKAANPNLIVIAESGDGCTYGEGGNHFIHTVRRNPDITNIVHNNMIYGLTKGQASPTSRFGMKTGVQVEGVILDPFNPLTIAISLDASFVARTYAGDTKHMKAMMKQAIQHKGYALLDILQPCVSFNKLNTYQWFKERVYYLEESHDPKDRFEALKRASEVEKFPLGVFYTKDKPTFLEKHGLYQRSKEPLIKRERDLKKFAEKFL
ncbi:MAG: 2-oxoacid ferredoxin oxidoreductase [Candidatus Heimdallarchaeota archaeon]|nr:2-oxoacid ferredoxin oxidoreductase [Candidatus Heimdallarchaeota archaeon]MBY8993809.1 2-oxoacid ferredoxin oxidoreductase [Candidatus Heimdallarchaeota archaeon]